MQHRLSPLLTLAVVLSACSDTPLSSGAAPLPEAQANVVAVAADFTFLAPLGAATLTAGEFNRHAAVEVDICAGSSCAAAPLAVFTTNGAGPSRVRLLDDQDGFIVNWDTHAAAAQAGSVYTIRVRVGEQVRGSVGVQMVGRGADVKNVPAPLRGAVAGQTLPIKFWLSRGSDEASFGAGGGSVELDGGAVTVEAPAGAVAGNTTITVTPLPNEPGSGIFTVYDFGPDGSQFARPLTITLPFPAGLPPGGEPGLYWRQNENSQWAPLDNGGFDAATGRVWGEISHFTQIGVRIRRLHVCSGSGVATLGEAVALIAPRGEITLCNQPHFMYGVDITQPVTIMSAGDFKAQLIGQAGEYGLRVMGIEKGRVTLQNLAFLGHQRGVVAQSLYDEVVIEGSTFNTISYGVQITGTSVAGARVTVRDIEVLGGLSGVFAANAPHVDVLDSRFYGQTFSNIQWQGVANGSIVGNTISACGRAGCIRAPGVGELQIVGNTMSTENRGAEFPAQGSGRPGVQFGIVAAGTNVLVENNVVTGIGDIVEPNNVFSYAIADAGISTPPNNDLPSNVTLRGNRVTNALYGITAVRPAGFPAITVTATDNVIAHTAFGLLQNGGARILLKRNDFTNHLVPFTASFVQPGDFTCNWWGSADGPVRVNSFVSWGAYMPAAAEPIAGKPGVSCNPTPAPPPALVRYCPGGALAPTTFVTMGIAVGIVADGGTVEVCNGDFSAGTTALRKPVTIRAESGAAPVLNGNTNPVFNINNAAPGTITISGLGFRNSRWASIDVQNGYDRVVVENSTFHPSSDPAPPGSFGHWAGVSVGQGPGNGVYVYNSTFVGGDIGVNAWGNARFEVAGSSFSGQINQAVHVGGGSTGTVSSSQIECNSNLCLGSWAAARVVFLNNVITVNAESGIPAAIQVGAAEAVVSGNTITGQGGTVQPWQPATWPIQSAIYVGDTPSASVTGNTITRAFNGIAFGSSAGQVENNIVSAVNTGLVSWNGSALLARFNNFTGYVESMGGNSFAAGSAACNWWGSAAGPSNVAGGVPSAWYSPWAVAPIAGTGNTCN